MNTTVLWIVQILLGLAFILAGLMKLSSRVRNCRRAWAGSRISRKLKFA